jgi:lysophospholipase L1-like esterase
MPGVIAIAPKWQFFDNNGDPLVGGFVHIYAAGTTTRRDTWQDREQTILNTNPIELDSVGVCQVWLDAALAYKRVVTDADGVELTQYAADNMVGASDADAIAASASGFADAAAASAAAAAVSATEAEEFATSVGGIYLTKAAGIADTVSGQLFQVRQEFGEAVDVNLNSAGAAVYQETRPFGLGETARLIQSLQGSSLTASQHTLAPMISINSFDALMSDGRNVPNRAALTAPSKNIINFDTGDIRTVTVTNVTTTKNFATIDGVLATRFQITNAANGLFLWSGTAPPAGTYKYSYKVRMNAGEGSKDLRHGNSIVGYATATISDAAWTTLTGTFTASGANYTSWSLVPAVAAVLPFDLLVGEVQFHEDDGNALPAFSAEPPPAWHAKASLLSQLGAVRGTIKRDDMVLDLENTGSAVLKANTWPATRTFTEFSAIALFRNRLAAAGQILVTETDAALGTNANTMQIGVAVAGTLNMQPVNAGFTNINVLGQGWHPAGLRLKDGSRQCFFHEIELNSSSAAWAGFPARLLRLGGQTFSSPMDGDLILMDAWGEYLEDADWYAAVQRCRDIAGLCGETMGTFRNFYIAEGDSRTALLNTSYAYLMGNAGEFTPNLFLRNFAVSGSSAATLTARLPNVQRAVDQAVMAGARPIISVLVGTNDATAVAASGAAAYYTGTLKPLWAAYKAMTDAVGGRFIAATELPRGNDVPGYEAERVTLNGLIRGDATLYDALADFASDPVMGDPDSFTLTPGNWTDALHPNAAGHLLLKPYMRAALASVMA